MNKKPILVTDSHRSGTTWVGRMIAKSPSVGYIHEPFHLNRRPGINRAINLSGVSKEGDSPEKIK